MVNYKFKERNQPKSREHLGILEKHKDAIERLKKIKEESNHKKILKSKIENQTGNEFLFRMENTRKRGNVIVRINDSMQKTGLKKNVGKKTKLGGVFNSNIGDEKYVLRNIEHEIRMAEKKIKEIVVRPKGKHVRFDDDEKNRKEEVNIDFGKNEKTYKKYKSYLDKLLEVKAGLKK